MPVTDALPVVILTMKMIQNRSPVAKAAAEREDAEKVKVVLALLIDCALFTRSPMTVYVPPPFGRFKRTQWISAVRVAGVVFCVTVCGQFPPPKGFPSKGESARMEPKLF